MQAGRQQSNLTNVSTLPWSLVFRGPAFSLAALENACNKEGVSWHVQQVLLQVFPRHMLEEKVLWQNLLPSDFPVHFTVVRFSLYKTCNTIKCRWKVAQELLIYQLAYGPVLTYGREPTATTTWPQISEDNRLMDKLLWDALCVCQYCDLPHA